MGAPLDLFLCILFRSPSQISFFAYYTGPPFGGYMLAKTLVVFYVWSPDIFVLSFYQNLFSGIAYSIMSNKTLPYHTIDHLFAYYYYMYMHGLSQISFFAYYMGAPSNQFYRSLYGAPQISFFTYYIIMGPWAQVSFCAGYIGPLRSVFVHTTCIWGPT